MVNHPESHLTIATISHRPTSINASWPIAVFTISDNSNLETDLGLDPQVRKLAYSKP